MGALKVNTVSFQLGLTLGNVLVYPGSADSLGCAARMGLGVGGRVRPPPDNNQHTASHTPPTHTHNRGWVRRGPLGPTSAGVTTESVRSLAGDCCALGDAPAPREPRRPGRRPSLSVGSP
jgi:hypothetical protein